MALVAYCSSRPSQLGQALVDGLSFRLQRFQAAFQTLGHFGFALKMPPAAERRPLFSLFFTGASPPEETTPPGLGWAPTPPGMPTASLVPDELFSDD